MFEMPGVPDTESLSEGERRKWSLEMKKENGSGWMLFTLLDSAMPEANIFYEIFNFSERMANDLLIIFFVLTSFSHLQSEYFLIW